LKLFCEQDDSTRGAKCPDARLGKSRARLEGEMTAVGYWLVLIVLFGVLVPIGLRLLAVPVIRAYERAVADRAQVAAGLAISQEVERAARVSRTEPPTEC
jgi:hypothetical protein